MILWQTREKIEPDRTCQIGWIEIDEIITTAAGKKADGGFGQIAVRIEQRKTAACGEVLRDQVEERPRGARCRSGRRHRR